VSAERDFLSGGGETGALMRAHDWSASPLGPPAGWPQSLRAVVALMMNSRHPMFVAWGPELAFLYNDDYAPILGAKHPRALGRPFRDVWAEIWDDILPLVERALAGEATYNENLHLVLERNGHPEDTWYSFSYSPVRDENGRAAGMFCACAETTDQILAGRRQAFRLAIEERLRGLASDRETMAVAAEMLGRHFSAIRAGYAEMEQGGDHTRVEDDWRADGVASAAGRHRLDSYGPEFAAEYRAGRTVVVEDFEADPRSAGLPAAEAHSGLGVRAQIVVPLVKAGRLAALLFVHSAAPRRWADEDVALAREVAERTWAAVERARAEAALRESEERFKFLDALSEATARAFAPREIMATTAKLLGTHLRVTRCAYADVDGDNNRFTIRDDWTDGAPSSVGEYSLDLFGARAAADMRAGRVLAIRNVDEELPAGDGREMFNAIGIKAIICCPLVKQDRLVAMMAVHQFRPRDWTKGEEALLETVVERAWAHIERVRAEEALRESEARFRTMAESIPQLAWMAGPDGRVFWYNRRWYDYTGTTLEAMQGRGWRTVHHPDHVERVIGEMQGRWAAGRAWEGTYLLRAASGEYRWFLTRAEPIENEKGELIRWFGTNTDITAQREAEAVLARHRAELERLVEERTAALLREAEERRRAEEALRQGEKLQAIGQLTGGIAHDFNNILQVVSSGAQLLKMPRLSEERRAVVLDGMSKAAQNAKELTGRLLAFARKQALQPEAFDLNARLAGMSELLRHTLGSGIRVETDFAPGLPPVMADPSQLEVALLNLAVNARDAMLPEGGVVSLRTRAVWLEATSERAAGEYVCVAVKDTGPGIPPAVLARVFEPFFTTKGPDKGTGLGLAQVHGFAKQSRGDVSVESAPGEGTTVLLHLPRAGEAERRGGPAARAAADTTAGAAMQRAAGRTVLVVDDNPDVAAFAASMLEGLGYATRNAGNAAEALALLDADGAGVDAVFSDVVMPGEMSGVQLAGALRMRHPRIAVLLATGYSEVLADWSGQAVAEVLGKPYRLDDLAAALERAFAAVGTAGRRPELGAAAGRG
jgi:PAS domain S-box-containing protein